MLYYYAYIFGSTIMLNKGSTILLRLYYYAYIFGRDARQRCFRVMFVAASSRSFDEDIPKEDRARPELVPSCVSMLGTGAYVSVGW